MLPGVTAALGKVSEIEFAPAALCVKVDTPRCVLWPFICLTDWKVETENRSFLITPLLFILHTKKCGNNHRLWETETNCLVGDQTQSCGRLSML